MAGEDQDTKPRKRRVKTASVKGSRLPIVNEEDLPPRSKSASIIKKKSYYSTAATSSGIIKHAGVGFGGMGNIGLESGVNVSDSSQQALYSPIFSKDFLELPQTQRDKHVYFRHFYARHPLVGRAIDIHSELPMSKVRLTLPQARDPEKAQEILAFFERMCDHMQLFQRLLEIAHEWWLLGNTFIFAEFNDQLKIWDRLVVLDPDTVEVKTYPFSTDVTIELIPSEQIVGMIRHGTADPEQMEQLKKIPKDIRMHILEGRNLPLDTDPYSGSHVTLLARAKSGYQTLGYSILERCLPYLVYEDKIRQAQTQIATRHMTPVRVVTGPPELAPQDVDNLRDQVDMALVDPDFSIIANYDINWNEIGANGRLLEVSTEMEFIENKLLAGLGVTRELLIGEGSYAGNRINLEIMNNQYLLFREKLRTYVEENLFKPIAKANGFVDKDKFGHEIIVYPRLSFTRLSIRDSSEFFDQVFSLYQKGSVSIDLVLELLNLDPLEVDKKLRRDVFTLKDSVMNEALRQAYTTLADKLVDGTDMFDRVRKNLGLKVQVESTEEDEGADSGGGMGDLDLGNEPEGGLAPGGGEEAEAPAEEAPADAGPPEA